MFTFGKKGISFFLFITVVLSLFSVSAAATEVIVDSYTAGSGAFSVNRSSRFYIVSEAEPEERLLKTVQLVQGLFQAAGKPSDSLLPIYYGDDTQIRNGDIVFRSVKNPALGEEGYKLLVTQERLILEYEEGTTSFNAVLYGMQSVLKSMIRNDSDSMDACTITAVPDTAERTVMLDCARKYWSVNWIKNLISEMSWLGYNSLELHITEDQGYLANIWQGEDGRTIPDCNGNDFSWIIGGHTVSWNMTYPEASGKSYSADALEEIVRYAQERHIAIIPALDFPTHCDSLIAKFKQNYASIPCTFQYDGKDYSFSGSIAAYNAATLNVVDENARSLAFAITDAYADFFRSLGCTKINIGADEVSGASAAWAESAYTTSNGGHNAKDAFVIFINQMTQMLQTKGYHVRAYNDCLFGNGFYVDGAQDATPATVAVNPDLEVCIWTPSKLHTSPSDLSQTRTVYNCINYYTYYVLRKTSANEDARDAKTTWWPFNHATPTRIFEGCGPVCATYSNCQSLGGWNPSKFYGCESGDYQETVTGEHLGGGYFLIWGDWAELESEANIWDGQSINDENDYSLINRLWSNAVKQWNWEAENTVCFEQVKDYREAVKLYPGYISCTAAVPIYLNGRPSPAVIPTVQESQRNNDIITSMGEDASVRNSEPTKVGTRIGFIILVFACVACLVLLLRKKKRPKR